MSDRDLPIEMYWDSQLVCPTCGAHELDEETQTLNIRGYKVGDCHGWWSFCLGCNIWFVWSEDPDGRPAVFIQEERLIEDLPLSHFERKS